MPENYEVTKDLTPDFWVKPEVVVELAADEITVSPANKHTAGYALRFPRLIKFRDDKSVKQATTLRELKDLFKLQKH
jgi:DNA ligase-1